jgi:glycosyltransferase involved in cell wall biosynthesis
MYRLKILFIEAFYGGSHRAFADGLINHSRYDIHLISLPARFWKWRLRGASLHFSREIENWQDYDLIISGGMMSLADLKALAGPDLPPLVLYSHESQLSYPLPPEEKIDYQFGFTDISNCLTADGILFNSRFHLDAFFHELGPFLQRIPEYRPDWIPEAIRKKSRVMYPGCELSAFHNPPKLPRNNPPLILWNHRWEFDKAPEKFFKALELLDKKGLDFRLALLGESSQKVPKPFKAAREHFGKQIAVYGYRKSREEYDAWLRKSDIVISTALQENFGISIVEAVAAGAYPLLPRRLAYPEVLPDCFHREHLYRNVSDLVAKLEKLLKQDVSPKPELSRSMMIYDWENCIDEYDDYFRTLAEGRK